MYGLDDPRRKINHQNSLKHPYNSHSHSSLLNNLDKKRVEPSKDKTRITQMPEQGDYPDPKSGTINFRAIKNNQNAQQLNKANKEYYQLKINKKHSASDHANGIQINVNIQNMLPQNRRQNLTEATSDRSLSRKRQDDNKQPKKPKKVEKPVTSNNALDQFQCSQTLETKPEPKIEKKSQPMIDKNNKACNVLLKPKKPLVNDFQRQIKEFQDKQQEIMMMAEAEAVCFLDQRQIGYEIDPLYIQKRQTNLSWKMRATLIDWMMHISYQFKLKRETLYLAITLVDNYFQLAGNLVKADFQLTGAASLFITAKLQEFQPLSSKQFAKSTKERYSAEQIRRMQTRIVKTLKYYLNPPTINMWANKLMQQWDLFLQSSPSNKYFQSHQQKYFKRIDDDSYNNYIKVMQILDCTILDIQTVQYKPKILVCSIIYLILGKELKQFSKKKITDQFPRTSLFFLEETSFNSLFQMFLEKCLGLNMFELLPSVQYLATYFSLPLTLSKPQINEEEYDNMHLEEYCSIQTYNPHMLSTVHKRFRGIYQ